MIADTKSRIHRLTNVETIVVKFSGDHMFNHLDKPEVRLVDFFAKVFKFLAVPSFVFLPILSIFLAVPRGT